MHRQCIQSGSAALECDASYHQGASVLTCLHQSPPEHRNKSFAPHIRMSEQTHC
ncbi:hypothetical protein [Vibrio parahaemolyticus]|uniref:hypothetical protein n=1 Tax=Vibrio parahaemolyticus TaxID=670 RepID=UPI00214BF15E|nr:hypothetical protein [Vibrio parahaemolyticus]